jgi:hypothetical protein
MTMPAIKKRTFTQTIDSLRRGALADELDKELQKLVVACRDTERTGALTLSIKIKPSKNGAFELIDELKVTMPKPEKGSSIMYPTVEGHLQRNDPAQGELEGLRSVEDDTREIRKVAST